MIGVGLVGALGLGGRVTAQQLSWGDVTVAATRLTVQPRTMATGTVNPSAGEYLLDSVPDYRVTVPPACAGAHRCPLLVFLPGGGYGAQGITDEVAPAVRKHGVILLAATVYAPPFVDAGLREVLRRFAIDPAKIAISGRCRSGAAGWRLGVANLDIFNRIGAVSGGFSLKGFDPRNTTAEFFIDNGISEGGGIGRDEYAMAAAMRRDGHPVQLRLGFRGHEHHVWDYDFLLRWLEESWVTPNRAARPALPVVADPLPVLTVDALQRMTAFWTRFQQEPDSIRTVGREAHLREVAIPVAPDLSIVMTDMAALAAQYPAVAADLKAVGLTAQQHDAYRLALVAESQQHGATSMDSVLAKNVAFMEAHPDEARALQDTGMWRTP